MRLRTTRQKDPVQRRRCAAALLLAVATPLTPTAPPLHAAQSDDERYYTMPAQPLTQALATFARESGVDIFYETELVRGRSSAPLDGHYSAAMALRALLAGTGLEARFTSRRSAYVFAPDSSRAPSGSPISASGESAPMLRLDMARVRTSPLIGEPNTPSFDAYTHRAVREIRAMLNAEGGFDGPRFNVAIVVGIDPRGQVGSVRLTPESRARHPKREADIRARLVGRSLSQPPPEDFTMPLRFEISSVRTSARDQG